MYATSRGRNAARAVLVAVLATIIGAGSTTAASAGLLGLDGGKAPTAPVTVLAAPKAPTAPATTTRTTTLAAPNAAAATPQCNDSVDNDGDGRVDYGVGGDPGCSSASDDSEVDSGAPAGGTPACNDTIDNDNDGKVDYGVGGDPGCSSASDPSEVDSPACSDGRDNDGDGKVDYTGNNPDPGCSSAEDGDETDTTPAQPACNDTLDNDGDGKVDYGSGGDPGCSSASDNDETNPPGTDVGGTPQCNDSIDNDGDGTVDYGGFNGDAGCTSASDDSEETNSCAVGGLLDTPTIAEGLVPGLNEDGPISSILHDEIEPIFDASGDDEISLLLQVIEATIHEVSCIVALVESILGALPDTVMSILADLQATLDELLVEAQGQIQPLVDQGSAAAAAAQAALEETGAIAQTTLGQLIADVVAVLTASSQPVLVVAGDPEGAVAAITADPPTSVVTTFTGLLTGVLSPLQDYLLSIDPTSVPTTVETVTAPIVTFLNGLLPL